MCNRRFPTDPSCRPIDQQFLWGSSLLISPVLEEGAVEVKAYLPAGVWYSLMNVSHRALPVTFELMASATFEDA